MTRSGVDEQREERFELGEELGRGGMAVVYRAYDRKASMDVALKVLHSHLVDDEEMGEAFEREGRLLRRFDHPAIARVLETTQIDDRPALVMPEYTGGDLHRRRLVHGALSEEEATDIAVVVLEALQKLHDAGVVHGDVKPHNIVFDDEDRPVLIDLGIGIGQEAATAASDAQLGTVEYMAPERIDGMAVDGRSDLYSLAVVLFELVCGHVPYRADSPGEVMRMHRDDIVADPSAFESSLSTRICEVIRRAMARHPEQRFDSADEMRTVLLGASTQTEPLSIHARWERLHDDYVGDDALAAPTDGDEWVVILDQHSRKFTNLTARQYKAVRELAEAYPEHYSGPRLAPMVDVDFAKGSTWTGPDELICGVSRRGAEQLAERLEEAHVPVRIVRRQGDHRQWRSLYRWLWMSTIGLWAGVFVVALAAEQGPAISDWLAGPLLVTACLSAGLWMGVFGFRYFSGAGAKEWWLVNMSDDYALDFRGEVELQEAALVERRHAEAVQRVRSPRIRASLERAMSNALHLRDIVGGDSAANSRLDRIVRGITTLAESVVETEQKIDAIRPGAVVRRIEELDRRLAADTGVDAAERLVEQKVELREQLRLRDHQRRRLQARAQRVLEVAGGVEELVRKFRLVEDKDETSATEPLFEAIESDVIFGFAFDEDVREMSVRVRRQ